MMTVTNARTKCNITARTTDASLRIVKRKLTNSLSTALAGTTSIVASKSLIWPYVICFTKLCQPKL